MLNSEGGKYNMRRALFRYRSQHTWSLPAHTRKRIFTTALHNGIDRYLTQWAGRDWKTKRKETRKGGREEKFLASRQAGRGWKVPVLGYRPSGPDQRRTALFCRAGPFPLILLSGHFIHFISLPPPFLSPSQSLHFYLSLWNSGKSYIWSRETTIIWYQKRQDQQRIDFGRFHIPPLASIRSDFIHYNLHFPWVQIVVYLKKN